MAKSSKKMKQAEKTISDLQKTRNKENLISVIILLCIALSVILIVWGSDIFGFFGDIIEKNTSYEKYMDKRNYIDYKKDFVILTYPTKVVEGQVETTVETLEAEEEVYEVRVNEDNSITARMSKAHYEKIKNALEISMNSIAVSIVSETSAIRDYYTEDDYKKICITVDQSREGIENEANSAIFLSLMYHTTKMNNDVNITLEYTDSITGEVYKEEVYNINGDIISSEEYEITAPTEIETL